MEASIINDVEAAWIDRFQKSPRYKQFDAIRYISTNSPPDNKGKIRRIRK